MANFYLELHNKNLQNTLIESRVETFSLDLSVDDFIQILKNQIFNTKIGPGETISVVNSFKALHEGNNSKLREALVPGGNGRYEITATLVPQQKSDGVKVEITRQFHNKKNFQTIVKFANTIEAELDKLKNFNQLDPDEVLYYGDELLDPKKRISDFSFFVNASSPVSLTARKSQPYFPQQQKPINPQINLNQPKIAGAVPYSNNPSQIQIVGGAVPHFMLGQPKPLIINPIQLKPAAIIIRVKIDDVPFEVQVQPEQTIYWLENQLNKLFNSRRRIYINGVLGTPELKIQTLINSEFSLDTYQQSPDQIKVIFKDKMSPPMQFEHQILSSCTVQELEQQILFKLFSQVQQVDQHINLFLMGDLLMISTNKLSQYPLYDQITIYYQLTKSLQYTVAPFRKIIQFQNQAREFKLQIDQPVGSFKQIIISEIFGNQPTDICIKFQDKVLQDHLTFIQEGIKSQQMVDSIYIDFGTQIQIIEEQTGQQISVTVQKSQTIQQVKEKLSSQFDYDFDLVFNQQTLPNDITIGQLGILFSNPLRLTPNPVFYVNFQNQPIPFPLYKKHSLQFIHDWIINQCRIQEQFYFTDGRISFDMTQAIEQLQLQPNEQIYMFSVDLIKIVIKLSNGQTSDQWVNVKSSILILEQFEPESTIRVGQSLIKDDMSIKEAGVKFGDVIEFTLEKEIQIQVQVVDNQASINQVFAIIVDRAALLNEVYQQLKILLQVQQNFKLTRNNFELDLNRSVEQNGIQQNDQIQLIIEASRQITLIIVLPNKSMINHKFNDSILLMAILQSLNFSPENHFFTKNGQELDLNKTLRDNQLEQGDQIVLNQQAQYILLHIQLPDNTTTDVQIFDNILLLELLQHFVKTDISLFQIRKNNQPLDLNQTVRQNDIVNDDSIQIFVQSPDLELNFKLPNLSQVSCLIPPSTLLEQVVAQLIQNDSPSNYNCTKNELLLDSNRTLRDLGLQKGDSIVLAKKPKVERPEMQITLVITMPNMAKVSYPFSESLLLEEVMAALIQNDSPSNYFCTKSGLLLDSNKTLKDLGLIKGDSIVLVKKPKVERPEMQITLVLTLPNMEKISGLFHESLLLEQVVAAIIKNDSPSKYICIKNGQQLDLKKKIKEHNLVKGDQIQLQIQKQEIDFEIKFQNQQSIKLKMDSSERVQKLLGVLGQKQLIESSNIQFYKNGQLLEIMLSLSENKVNSGDIIQCVQVSEEIIGLNISVSENNQQFNMEAANTMTIHELLLTVTENFQLSENDFYVYKDGRILDNNTNCAQNGLKDQDHLKVMRNNQKQNQTQQLQQPQPQNIQPSQSSEPLFIKVIGLNQGYLQQQILAITESTTVEDVLSVMKQKNQPSKLCYKNQPQTNPQSRISSIVTDKYHVFTIQV